MLEADDPPMCAADDPSHFEVVCFGLCFVLAGIDIIGGVPQMIPEGTIKKMGHCEGM